MAVLTTHRAKFSILESNLPARGRVAAGVLLQDCERGQLYIRLRRDWDRIAPEEAEVLASLESDLSQKAAEMGAEGLLDYLEETLSNFLTIGDRRESLVEDFPRALNRLYRQNVQTSVREFVTHVPRYSLAVAAGKFLDNDEVDEEGWEEIPPGVKPVREMFAARIAGRSMEPLIPDGSICLFRAGVPGSRNEKLVLVEMLGRGSNDRYTVKRYRSEKTEDAEGNWMHARIRMEPLNPEFEAWDLDAKAAENLRVIAEFVCVLD